MEQFELSKEQEEKIKSLADKTAEAVFELDHPSREVFVKQLLWRVFNRAVNDMLDEEEERGQPEIGQYRSHIHHDIMANYVTAQSGWDMVEKLSDLHKQMGLTLCPED